MEVIKMIDELNANDKVRVVQIYVNEDNEFNEEMMMMMVENYYEVYDIYVRDGLERSNKNVHC